MQQDHILEGFCQSRAASSLAFEATGEGKKTAMLGIPGVNVGPLYAVHTIQTQRKFVTFTDIK